MAENSPEQILYNGEIPMTVDSSRRTPVPAKWLPAGEAKNNVEFTIVIWPKHPDRTCLKVLTQSKMIELVAKINASQSDKGEMKRSLGRASTQVKVDTQGRICIPEWMAGHAGISDKVIFVGTIDSFEIWSPERNDTQKHAEAARLTEIIGYLDNTL